MTNRTESPKTAGFVLEMVGPEEASFRLDGDATAVIAAFNDLLERRDAGSLSDSEFLSSLQCLLAGNPWFAPASAHLAFLYFEQDDVENALAVSERALEQLKALIPAGFAGLIGWNAEENQIFLRLLHLVALCDIRLRRHTDAAQTLDLLLRYCPEDPLGARL